MHERTIGQPVPFFYCLAFRLGNISLAGALIVLGFASTCSVCQADENIEFFESRIRPVLVEHCYRCHSADSEIQGGLRLDSREAVRKGGDSGPAVIPRDKDESLILSALKYDSFEMPPDQKLPDHVIADFEKWILHGAEDPRDDTAPIIENVQESQIDFEAGKQFWSFRPPVSDVPGMHDLKNWIQTPVDEYVAAKLTEQALQHSPRAASEKLMRRLSFDLTGLPPDSPWLSRSDELESPQGVAEFVDDLLATDAYGEHLARMWLDLMRYADDQAHIVGNNTALCFPNAYMYRDWVIDAFNADMPYSQFVQLQLAADLLTPDDRSDDVALGFVGLGPKYYRRNSPEVMADELEDRVDVLSRGLLGLTVACARCHDHKYDPVGTADYYALAGVFASVEMFNRPLDDSREVGKKGNGKKPDDSLHIIRDVSPKNLSIAIRGDVKRNGPIVPRGFLTVLSTGERTSFSNGSGRLELAKEITSNGNPLTARVIVNRIWARLIGQPLVATPSNFGKLGTPPTHPELLDDLAVRFMSNGWSLKWLCREIVLSATYQQASGTGKNDSDPENTWLSRMNRKRLNVEQWRDALLVAANKLDRTSRAEHLDPSDVTATRRTIYSDSSRLKLNPMLALFDYPDPNVHSGKRATTTSAAQKLFLMNSPFIVDVSEKIAERLENQTKSEAIATAYRLIYARSQTPSELEVGLNYLEQASLTEYVHALLLANEMLFLD